MLKPLLALAALAIAVTLSGNVANATEFGMTPVGSNAAHETTVEPLSAAAQLVDGTSSDHSFCSVFYIGNNRFITAGHCAAGSDSPMHVLFRDGTFKRLDVEIVAVSDPDRKMADFAILEAASSDKDGKPITLSSLKDRRPVDIDCKYKSKVGDDLRIEGSPADLGFITVWGKVAGATEKWALWDKPVIRTNMTVSNGDSGAVVFNDKTNKAIGILVGALPKNQNLSAVQPIAPICDLLNLK